MSAPVLPACEGRWKMLTLTLDSSEAWSSSGGMLTTDSFDRIVPVAGIPIFGGIAITLGVEMGAVCAGWTWASEWMANSSGVALLASTSASLVSAASRARRSLWISSACLRCRSRDIMRRSRDTTRRWLRLEREPLDTLLGAELGLLRTVSCFCAASRAISAWSMAAWRPSKACSCCLRLAISAWTSAMLAASGAAKLAEKLAGM